MSLILATTLPLFLLIGLGYGAVRFGPFTPDQVRGMGVFVINVALPALLFRLLATQRLQDLAQWRYLIVYGGASIALMLGAIVYWRRARGCDAGQGAIRGFGMAVSNSGFVGLPIALQFIGARAAIGLAMCFVIENLIMFPLLMILGQGGGDGGRGALARRIGASLVRSPLILAIVAACVALATGLRPPASIGAAIDLLAQAASPLALFVIGGSLVGLDLRGKVGAGAQIAAGKLLLHPLLVFALMLLVPIADPRLRATALLIAGVPMASTYPIFAQRYGEGPLAAAALLGCTVASFVTLNLLLLLIGTGFLGWVAG